MEVTKRLKPPVKRAAKYGGSASCTGRNVSERRASLEKDVAQADPTAISGKADTTGRVSKSDPSRCAGVVATACTQGKRTQHGKPDSVVGRGDQLEAGDGQRGRYGVAERLVVLRTSGNADRGKGP